MATPDDDAAIHEWSLSLMMDAFRELAFALATIDTKLADSTIQSIEAGVATKLAAFREEQAKRVGADAVNIILRQVATPFREMTQGTRAMIQKSGKPEH